MTENENIEKILYMGVGRSGLENELSIISKALSELMEYRAIGTVDEVAEMSNSYINYFHKVRKYQAIGTIEEFKALKEDKNFLEFLYNHIPPNEMEQYLSMYHIKEKIAVNGYVDQSGLMSAT